MKTTEFQATLKGSSDELAPPNLPVDKTLVDLFREGSKVVQLWSGDESGPGLRVISGAIIHRPTDSQLNELFVPDINCFCEGLAVAVSDTWGAAIDRAIQTNPMLAASASEFIVQHPRNVPPNEFGNNLKKEILPGAYVICQLLCAAALKTSTKDLEVPIKIVKQSLPLLEGFAKQRLPGFLLLSKAISFREYLPLFGLPKVDPERLDLLDGPEAQLDLSEAAKKWCLSEMGMNLLREGTDTTRSSKCPGLARANPEDSIGGSLIKQLTSQVVTVAKKMWYCLES